MSDRPSDDAERATAREIMDRVEDARRGWSASMKCWLPTLWPERCLDDLAAILVRHRDEDIGNLLQAIERKDARIAALERELELLRNPRVTDKDWKSLHDAQVTLREIAERERNEAREQLKDSRRRTPRAGGGE